METGLQQLYIALNTIYEKNKLRKEAFDHSPKPITISELFSLVNLSYNTIASLIRQLLVLGYLSRPKRGVYYVMKPIPKGFSKHKMEKEYSKEIHTRNNPKTIDYNF